MFIKHGDIILCILGGGRTKIHLNLIAMCLTVMMLVKCDDFAQFGLS